MSDWPFGYHEVLQDPDGYWWHVVERYKCIDTGRQMYRLYDGTHTGDRYESAESVKRNYESLGWETDTKPAHEHGYRVNGVLCEPMDVERWLGNSCVSDHDCPACGESTEQAADIVVSHQHREVAKAEIRCGACGETNEVQRDD
jgi:hypothetical protein